MTINEAIEILQREYNCRIDKGNVCASSISCNRCEHYVDADIVTETLKTVLDAFGNCLELPNSSDLVSRSYLLAEYDRQHEGPPGGARKIIEEAPAVLRNSEISESLKFEEIGKSALAGFENGIRNWFTDTEKDFEAAYSAQDFCSEDLIHRQAVLKDKINSIPLAQTDPTNNAEFWRRRAKDYENIINDLNAKISKGAKLESMIMNAEGIVFKMKEPPAQADQKWTPCIKEQPKKPGEYFITWTRSNSNGLFVGIAECEILNSYDFERNEFEVNWILDDLITDNYKDVKVIAWQQLIEPYRGDWES